MNLSRNRFRKIFLWMLIVVMQVLLGSQILYASAASSQKKISIKTADIELSKDIYVYNGSVRKPKVTVEVKDTVLKQNRDYKLAYSNNKNIGSAVITVTGKGNYKGTKKITFKIVPDKVKSLKISSKNPGQIAVTFKNVKYADGYEIQYISGSSMKKTSITKTSYTLKKLNPGEAYTVKVRAYKKVKGKKVYGNWSEKSVTVMDDTFSAEVTRTVDGEKRNYTYKYLDTFFKAKSTSLNAELAKASMALSAAAYTPGEVTDLLSQMGFSRVSAYNYDKISTEQDNDFAAYVSGAKEIILEGKKYNLVAVVVRGTIGDNEWISNFNVGTSMHHAGFEAAANEVLVTVKKNLPAKNKSRNILWITGHSRGAAVANLVAGELSTGSKNVNQNRIYAYTFGTPTVSKMADTSLKNVYNFCNTGDLVVHIPLTQWGYQRFGTTVGLRNQEQQTYQNFQTICGKSYEGYTGIPDVIGTLNLLFPTMSQYEEFAKTYPIQDILNGFISSGDANGKSIADGHCTELYWAWMNAL